MKVDLPRTLGAPQAPESFPGARAFPEVPDLNLTSPRVFLEFCSCESREIQESIQRKETNTRNIEEKIEIQSREIERGMNTTNQTGNQDVLKISRLKYIVRYANSAWFGGRDVCVELAIHILIVIVRILSYDDRSTFSTRREMLRVHYLNLHGRHNMAAKYWISIINHIIS